VAHADELCESEAERAALAKLRELSAVSDGPMERHCARVFAIACELAARSEADLDREVLLCAAWLHDAGLYPGAATRDAYVRDGRVLAEGLLAEHGWPQGRIARAADAIERHHELRPQWDHGTEVELLRRADLVDLSGGLVGFGLDRAWVRALRRSVPARGMLRVIGGLVVRAARERPLSLPRIFLRA
jgi:HD superfamily phosphodiesterase